MTPEIRKMDDAILLECIMAFSQAGKRGGDLSGAIKEVIGLVAEDCAKSCIWWKTETTQLDIALSQEFQNGARSASDSIRAKYGIK